VIAIDDKSQFRDHRKFTLREIETRFQAAPGALKNSPWKESRKDAERLFAQRYRDLVPIVFRTLKSISSTYSTAPPGRFDGRGLMVIIWIPIQYIKSISKLFESVRNSNKIADNNTTSSKISRPSDPAFPLTPLKPFRKFKRSRWLPEDHNQSPPFASLMVEKPAAGTRDKRQPL
jgi:hypothetical protein